MNEHFDISAVITTFNRSDMLATALEAVLGQKAEGVRYEVIVVDNNSTDNTRATIESSPSRGSLTDATQESPQRAETSLPSPMMTS